VKSHTGDPDKLNCMNQDGVRKGYDIKQLSAVRKVCPVPLIASGGAGATEHFEDVFKQAHVDGALAASVFHKSVIAIPDLKADAKTEQVLMLGYMNEASLAKTQETGLVTFYSRSRKELWTKGETSGNTLKLQSITVDCDRYTASLLHGPLRRAAQKVGEEGVETALAAVAESEDKLTSEAADLVYHLLVLLAAKDVKFESVIAELKSRHK